MQKSKQKLTILSDMVKVMPRKGKGAERKSAQAKGAESEIKEDLARAKQDDPHPIEILWQEDSGFSKTAAVPSAPFLISSFNPQHQPRHFAGPKPWGKTNARFRQLNLLKKKNIFRAKAYAWRQNKARTQALIFACCLLAVALAFQSMSFLPLP